MLNRWQWLRIGNQHGVSLLETLVALGLFAIAAGTMGDFLVQQIRMASTNHNVTTAYAYAEQELEDVRALDYAEIVSRSSSHASGALTFNIATTVLANNPAANMKKITVTVGWTEPGGARSVALNTIYTAVKR